MVPFWGRERESESESERWRGRERERASRRLVFRLCPQSRANSMFACMRSKRNCERKRVPAEALAKLGHVKQTRRHDLRFFGLLQAVLVGSPDPKKHTPPCVGSFYTVNSIVRAQFQVRRKGTRAGELRICQGLLLVPPKNNHTTKPHVATTRAQIFETY